MASKVGYLETIQRIYSYYLLADRVGLTSKALNV